MSPNDLAGRLEEEASNRQRMILEATAMVDACERYGNGLSAKPWAKHREDLNQQAADLRAAAAAVRLVAECREALAAIRNEVSAGCHPDAPVEELKTGIHYEPVLVVDTVIEKIAEWEGKHV